MNLTICMCVRSMNKMPKTSNNGRTENEKMKSFRLHHTHTHYYNSKRVGKNQKTCIQSL